MAIFSHRRLRQPRLVRPAPAVVPEPAPQVVPATDDINVTPSGAPIQALLDVTAYPQARERVTTPDGSPITAVRFVDSAGNPSIDSSGSGDIYSYGANGACGVADLAALDTMLADQVSDLPRLHVWAKTSVDVGSLIPGSDTCDPMPYLQKIFAAFDTPGLQGRHMIFGRQRAWNFQTRPGTGLGPQGQYLQPPQRCTLEWQREWDFSAYPQASNPTFFHRQGSYGSAISVVGSVARGSRTITVGAGQAAGLVFGQRMLIHNTALLTTLTGSYTKSEDWQPIVASISGTTLTVTQVTGIPGNLSTLVANITVGDEIGNYGADTSLLPNTRIVSQTSGTAAGIGVYVISNSHGTVSSRTMSHSNGNAARTEDLIVRSVSGDTITFENYLQDTYDATAVPVLKTYLNEPEIRLVNPLILGRGYPGSGGVDRMFNIRHCRNTIIEGGRISNFPESVKVSSSLGGRISDLDVYGIKEGLPGGGISLVDATSDFLVENCRSFGGGQMFMLTPQGDAWGILRDITFRDCIANGANNGFSHHNLNERVRYENCTVSDARGAGFDIRARDTTMTNCTVRNCAGSAVFVRPSASNFICDGLKVDKALSGVVLDIAITSAELDYNPGNITVKNSLLERIGGFGSHGSLKFDWSIVDELGAPVFPVLGRLTLANNEITMTDNSTPIVVKGKWTTPLIAGNVITGADGFAPSSTAAIFVTFPTGGTSASNPSNTTVVGNTRAGTYNNFIVGSTGTLIQAQTSAIGQTTTVPATLTTATTLTASQTGQIFLNTGATALVALTLPAADLAMRQVFEFYVTDADGINIIATPSQIRIGSSVLGASMSATAIGAWARLTRVTSTLWIAEVDAPANWTLA